MFYVVGIAVAVLGVFMCASRTQAVIMIALGITVSLSFRVRMTAYLAWGAIAVAIGYMVATSPRLQRFTTLQDTSYVQTRISGSVNEGFLQQAADYPLGNGLGRRYQHPRSPAGPPKEPGSNRERIRAHNGWSWESQACASGWHLFSGSSRARPPMRSDPWFIGRRLAYVACLLYLGTGVIGLGLLTWVPGTALLLFLIGWVAVPNTIQVAVADPFAPAVLRGDFISSRTGT